MAAAERWELADAAQQIINFHHQPAESISETRSEQPSHQLDVDMVDVESRLDQEANPSRCLPPHVTRLMDEYVNDEPRFEREVNDYLDARLAPSAKGKNTAMKRRTAFAIKRLYDETQALRGDEAIRALKASYGTYGKVEFFELKRALGVTNKNRVAGTVEAASLVASDDAMEKDEGHDSKCSQEEEEARGTMTVNVKAAEQAEMPATEGGQTDVAEGTRAEGGQGDLGGEGHAPGGLWISSKPIAGGLHVPAHLAWRIEAMVRETGASGGVGLVGWPGPQAPPASTQPHEEHPEPEELPRWVVDIMDAYIAAPLTFRQEVIDYMFEKHEKLRHEESANSHPSFTDRMLLTAYVIKKLFDEPGVLDQHSTSGVGTRALLTVLHKRYGILAKSQFFDLKKKLGVTPMDRERTLGKRKARDEEPHEGPTSPPWSPPAMAVPDGSIVGSIHSTHSELL